MPEDRVITFPADAAQRVADRLQDENWHLDGDDARDVAQEITIEITEAVDKLREMEADEAKPEGAYELGRPMTFAEAIMLTRRATFDPAQFTKRLMDHDREYESLERWQARAVVIALGPNGPTFEAKWGQSTPHPYIEIEVEVAQEARGGA